MSLAAVVLFTGGCERASDLAAAFPQPLTRESVCAADGMLLMAHPGPKGQILLADGETRYYCDLREFFEALNDPALKQRIGKSWVQPMDDRAWGTHAEGWAESGGLLYVLGSRRMGAMGPTMVPFRTRDAAHEFASNEGGRIVPASELTTAVLEAYAAEIRDIMRKHGPMAPQSGHGAMPMNDQSNQSMPMDSKDKQSMPHSSMTKDQ